MCRFTLTIIILFLAGCSGLPNKLEQSSFNNNKALAYNKGYEAGYDVALYDVKNNNKISVSFYALGPCNIYQTWVPKTGTIKPKQYWRAIRHERKQKLNCSARHNSLRNQVKALLGVIDDYE